MKTLIAFLLFALPTCTTCFGQVADASFTRPFIDTEIRAGQGFGVDINTRVSDKLGVFTDARKGVLQFGAEYRLASLTLSNSVFPARCDAGVTALGWHTSAQLLEPNAAVSAGCVLGDASGLNLFVKGDVGTYLGAAAGVSFDRVSISGSHDSFERRLDAAYALGQTRRYSVSAGVSDQLGLVVGLRARFGGVR